MKKDEPQLQDPVTVAILEKMALAHEAGVAAVQSSTRRMLLCVETGGLLRRKKEELGHGFFLKWFEGNIEDSREAEVMDFSVRTAQNWMRLSLLVEGGQLDLEEAGGLKRAYQLAGLLPDPEEGGGGVDGGGEHEPMALVKLKRLDTMVQSELTRHPIEKWSGDERRVWRERLRPFHALYTALQ